MNQSPLNSGLTLAETIEEIGSKQAVVAIDAANVQFWTSHSSKSAFLKNAEDRLSFSKLAECLQKIEAIKKRYFFTAKHSINLRFIERVIELVDQLDAVFLERAKVSERHGQVYEYRGALFDVELLLIVAKELIDSRRVKEVRHDISGQVDHALNQINSNKVLLKRENQGYEVVTTDSRVYKNTVAKMKLIGNLAREKVEVADFRESGIFNDIRMEVSYPQEIEVFPVKKSIEDVMGKLLELRSGLTQHVEVINALKEIVQRVENLDEEMKRREDDIKHLEKIYDQTRNRMKEIELIADKSANTLVNKGNVDSFLVAELMDARVMDEADTFVVFSGDGDFRRMYEKMLNRGKKVVVVSPLAYLNSNLAGMIEDGKISLVDPAENKEIWKKVPLKNSKLSR